MKSRRCASETSAGCWPCEGASTAFPSLFAEGHKSNWGGQVALPCILPCSLCLEHSCNLRSPQK